MTTVIYHRGVLAADRLYSLTVSSDQTDIVCKHCFQQNEPVSLERKLFLGDGVFSINGSPVQAYALVGLHAISMGILRLLKAGVDYETVATVLDAVPLQITGGAHVVLVTQKEVVVITTSQTEAYSRDYPLEATLQFGSGGRIAGSAVLELGMPADIAIHYASECDSGTGGGVDYIDFKKDPTTIHYRSDLPAGALQISEKHWAKLRKTYR